MSPRSVTVVHRSLTTLQAYSTPQTPSGFSAGRFVAEEENGKEEGKGGKE